jgi:hypothetical protein
MWWPLDILSYCDGSENAARAEVSPRRLPLIGLSLATE